MALRRCLSYVFSLLLSSASRTCTSRKQALSCLCCASCCTRLHSALSAQRSLKRKSRLASVAEEDGGTHGINRDHSNCVRRRNGTSFEVKGTSTSNRTPVHWSDAAAGLIIWTSRRPLAHAARPRGGTSATRPQHAAACTHTRGVVSPTSATPHLSMLMSSTGYQ